VQLAWLTKFCKESESETNMESSGMAHEKEALVNNGAGYYDVLRLIHALLRPRTYMEIGVDTGATLALAVCPAIAIDSTFARLQPDCIKPRRQTMLFQMSSDQFFSECDAIKLLGRRMDFVFLDGMHLIEFLIRDFLNAEAVCNPESIIAIHDCIPPDLHFTRRDPRDMSLRSNSAFPDGWGGDVWKLVPLLRNHRPALRVYCFNAAPSGLVLVTNLDPTSRLRRCYFDLLSEVGKLALPGNSVRDLVESFRILDTREIATQADFNRYFVPVA